MTKRLPPYVAICPDCDGHKNLHFPPPAEGGWWPHCDECTTSMNIYVRPLRAHGEEARTDG
jgi:hypothetical protein